MHGNFLLDIPELVKDIFGIAAAFQRGNIDTALARNLSCGSIDIFHQGRDMSRGQIVAQKEVGRHFNILKPLFTSSILPKAFFISSELSGFLRISRVLPSKDSMPIFT